MKRRSAVAAFDHRRFFRRAPVGHQLHSLLGHGVVPGERDEILEEEFADDHRVAAFAGANHPQSKDTRAGQKPASLLNGDQKFFAEQRHLVQNLAQPRARNAQQPRSAARDAGHDHRPAGEQINIPGKLARSMRHDMPVLIGRIQYLDRAGFDDEQIQIRIARTEDCFAILE